MLIIRELGRRTLAHDPEGWGWRTVIGRVLARTSLAFMILAAADFVSTYADLPPKIARLIDIFFVIAFALQGAIWVRELIWGLSAAGSQKSKAPARWAMPWRSSGCWSALRYSRSPAS